MEPGWFLLALLGPPLVAGAAFLVFRRRAAPPRIAIALNAVSPGAGLVALGRPLLEVVLAVLFAQAAMLVAGGFSAAGFLVPFMIVGGFWAAVHTPLSPVAARARTAGRVLTTDDRPRSEGVAGPSASAPDEAADPAEVDGDVYSVSIRCTECGADVDVPVLHRAARCEFCGSEHLVVGHDEVLQLTLPEKIGDEQGLREAVLDHYRHVHYVKLYSRTVAPLERHAEASSREVVLLTGGDSDPTTAAAEAVASRRADAYRARLARSLELHAPERFLAPYRHGVGTLYQAAFGREPKSGDKRLRFTVGSLESSRLASDILDLPAMGKLSWLRALRPAAGLSTTARALPLDGGDEAFGRLFGDVERCNLVRDLSIIRLGSRFHRDVLAVVWRPFWTVDVRADGVRETLLVDGASGSVRSGASRVEAAVWEDLPADVRRPERGLRFSPMECPTCGHEFRFDTDAVVSFCRNCHRAVRFSGGRKAQVSYDHAGGLSADDDLVPFWRFPFRLEVAGEGTITDLWHLKDGIDGTFDQIGDAPRRQDGLWVPAVRCVSARLQTRAMDRLLLFSVRRPPRLVRGRFPLDERVEPLPVGLEEDEARELAPLCLANLFGPRDIARVNVHQVAAWLFESRLASTGTLTWAPVPRAVTATFRDYLGRGAGRGLREARGDS